MSERTGGRIVLALLVTGAVVALLSVRVLDDLDASPRNDHRLFAFTGTRLAVVLSGDGRVRLQHGPGDSLAVSRELAGSAAKAGHSSWELTGSTLRLAAECTGIPVNCRVDYVVQIPAGTEVTVTSPGSVTAVGMCCPAWISTRTGDITVEGSLGPLRLSSESGRIGVREARSADVVASTRRAPVSLSFAAVPSQVVVDSDVGDISVELPDPPAPYHVSASGKDGGDVQVELRDVPSAERSIRARTREGAVRILKRK
ncbi:hypothetical protein ACFU7Y_29325 [Kitasatospora sp. NPDC057542]|uniref:hypothetical protein n=1 Tax=Streptomycetaceae TaxID=2062 RepID=UPI001CCA849B|nr:hypothetical protein [Streptomyces sp. LS1784]